MPLFLDTETTGLSPSRGDRIVEVAIVDDTGHALIDTLIDPQRPIPYGASSIHGISDSMVRGKPTLADLMPEIRRVVSSEHIVIYNSSFDVPFFPSRLSEAARIECAMRRYSEILGLGRWQKLDVAAAKVGHVWTGTAHRAKADALACRSVWNWMEQRLGERAATNPLPAPKIPPIPPSPIVTLLAHGPPPKGAWRISPQIWPDDKLRPPHPEKSDAYCPHCIQRHRVPAGARSEVKCIGCGQIFEARG